MVNGSYGGSSVIGIGRRPWLQKIATVTVAISLTVATADTFRVVEQQYNLGYIDSGSLTDDVVGSLEIRVVRVISDTFLWLAQVQTLIRLFPRHKEKVTIKWLGFAMVSLDTIFSILNDFVNQSIPTRPRSFQDAIPALSYLFELSISLIYASCVIYYALSKRRFAFYHPKMRNVCLVALLSLVAVLIPVVFFVLDVSNPDVAGWGDYIRWVGAAAASVVVWEWVERIEALERDERKDGILGREIFDGDEMLDEEPSEEVDWPGQRDSWGQNGLPVNNTMENGGGRGGHVSQQLRALRPRIPFAQRFRANPDSTMHTLPQTGATIGSMDAPSIPPQAATPISRSDTASAASTVYAIRYHTTISPSPAIPEGIVAPLSQADTVVVPKDLSTSTADDSDERKGAFHQPEGNPSHTGVYRTERNPLWNAVPNPFKRKRTSPPAEVAGAQLNEGTTRRSPVDLNRGLLSRLGGFTSSRRERLAGQTTGGAAIPMAVTVIPAQRRGNRTASPDFSEAQDEDSYVQTPTRAPDVAPAQTHQANRATTSPSPFPQHRDPEMPVTVIPAPRRGQRTWLPDDLHDNEPPHTAQTFATQGCDEQSTSLQSTLHQPPPAENGQIGPSSLNRMLFSNRGGLRFSEQSRRLAPSRKVPENAIVSSVDPEPRQPEILPLNGVERELMPQSPCENLEHLQQPAGRPQQNQR
jgi:PalH/RIM21